PLPPPVPTLFPYTTLFRSFANDAEGAHRGPPEVVLGVAEFLCGRDHELQRLDFRTLLESLLNERLDVAGQGREWTGFFDQLEILDRKSTRLNSSHVSISYA